jgi:anti-sigma factor RsiW
MICETYHDLIDDYVDGTRAADRPDDARRAAFESHLAGCARCQALVTDFTSIRRTASGLEEHVPPPRLWAKIAGTIEEKPRRFSTWIPVAVAASLALVIAGSTWLAWTRSPAADAPHQVTATSDETSLPPAEAQYAQAIAGLQQLADARNAALDPDTRAVLKQNLAVIDRAIDESRAALADEPASALAQESLLDALDTKVALLQDTVTLAAEDVNQ